ncbi:CorA family divalent cation transporter [Streptomyces sp. NPDC059072]|uniref:CorA family divalent cation transporter n=1 Tax=Streptomyces sp. NPDC059072 TaxID=3346715 RepID=UPI0036CCF302
MYDQMSGRSEAVECGLPDDAGGAVVKRLRGLGQDEFAWVRVADPAQGELVELAEELGLHPPAVEDALHGRRRPKRERFGDVLAVALKTLRYVEEEAAVETGDVMIFVGPRHLSNNAGCRAGANAVAG